MITKAHIRYRSKILKLKNGNGVIFPGVTTITRELGWSTESLVRWANQLGLEGVDSTKYRDDKADIGTLAHALVVDRYKGIETDVSDYTKNQIDKAENAALSYWEWEKQRKIEIIFAEEPLVSEEFQFGGTLDIYARVDGFYEIIDLKSGSGIWPEHFVQAGGGYRQLATENDCQVDRVRILNIPRAETENFRDEVIADTDIYWQIFLNCLNIYRLKKEIKNGINPKKNKKAVPEKTETIQSVDK